MRFALNRRLLMLALASAASPLPSWSAARQAVTVPPLPLSERTLANGLKVIALPQRGGATVSVQVWYQVGGKDDPVGRSGFAHLFEHMMFKSTKHMHAEMFDRLTEDVGGQNNAFTAEDVTAYQSEVPSNHLERLLWAEAERMANLDVVEANFVSERAVVQEEYRQRVLADPYGRLFNALEPSTFEVHPYRRSVIGSLEDLDAATIDDVRRFHRTFYRPDNATLIVAGDFEPKQLDQWVDRYFGPIARPAEPIPRVTVTEPPRTLRRRIDLHGPSVPLPALALTWLGPRARDADTPALDVASALLSGGDSSRLNQALVYDKQSARAAGFTCSSYADAGMIVAYAIASSGHRLEVLEAQLLQEIDRLARNPIPAAEMDKVRTRLLNAALLQRQTPQGMAEAAGYALVLHGDARHVDRELAELQAVTAADVQRVLKKHVLDAPRVSIRYTQGADK